MSAESIVIALRHSRARGTAKLVLIGIANHDGDGGAWPSIDTLSVYAGGIDARNVQKAINILVSLGEIRRVERGGGTAQTPGHLRPNLYHFLLACPPYCDGSRQHRDTRKAARYVPNYLAIMDDDTWQAGLKQDPPAVATPPGGSAGGPPANSSPHPPAVATPELNLKNATTNSPSGPELDAGARTGSEVPSADDWSNLIDRAQVGRGLAGIAPRPPCPKRHSLPCSIAADGACMDCGLTPEQLDAVLAEVTAS